ncbi:M48 family metallopeptidase [Marinobacter qingdaonensis]|uniref:M48 family metallopeptidase n=1 Tax=Marinobacter qingdaonensis TaxID=3108486 RepID=A0ABU5NYJ3_9GAMM|nr:M48 family metallopeptidase [Marinobacter sp. ASW11-75]MEA1080870.1 M48 family metallopeptidase [Marinobacter sp. ASW11-75]
MGFNLLTVVAPNQMVDYVVIHEFCQLIRHDHSPEFWRKLERMMPKYLQSCEWLRDNAMRSSI